MRIRSDALRVHRRVLGAGGVSMGVLQTGSLFEVWKEACVMSGGGGGQRNR